MNNISRKGWAILIVLILMMSVLQIGAYGSSVPTLKLDRVSGNVGEVISIPVSIENPDDIIGVEFGLVYDETMITPVISKNNVPVIEGEGTHTVVSGADAEEGTYKAVVVCSEPLNSSEELFSMKFKVLKDGDYNLYFDEDDTILVANTLKVVTQEVEDFNLEGLVRGWKAGDAATGPIEYDESDLVFYKGSIYQCTQDHTNNGNTNWDPVSAASLWKMIKESM